MQSTKRMIDKALRICQPQTKTQLGKLIGVSPQRLNDWESGYRHMPAGTVMRLAAMAKLDPIRELGEYEAEWQAKKGSALANGVAAVCLAGAGLLGGIGVHGDASARDRITPYLEYSQCTLSAVVRRLLRFGRIWCRNRFPDWMAHRLSWGSAFGL